MTELALFGSPASPFVKKVQRALRLKKLEYRLVEPAGLGDFKRWSPVTRKMPALRLDGEAVYDSTFIAERLDAAYPEPPLLSPEPSARAGQRLLEDWSDESLYWHLMALRWCDAHADATLEQISSGLPALVRPIARPMLRRMLRGQVRAQGMGRLPNEVVVRELGRRLDDLLGLLGERPFLFADAVSIADLAVFGQLEMGVEGPTPEVAALLGERPALGAYLGRVRAATGG
jgi:glutathione S-transferase